MTNYKGHIFQLGKCGLEQIGSLGGSWSQSQFCGKIAGGAAFCNGFHCYTYSDATGEIVKKPTVGPFLIIKAKRMGRLPWTVLRELL